jgi:anaerobic magnesium-protoporphyrin IX monomethyl ester cyclase
MKVLLINPWIPDVLPPPSIGYLQAALKNIGIDVVAKDLKQALQDNEKYDLVGVSFHSFSVKYAKAIRNKFKGHLICGGHHPSAMPDQMLKIGYDQVVVGEGENALIDIMNGNTNQVIYSKDCKGKYFKTINDFPIPDYSGLNFSGELGINIISSRGCPFACSFCASTDFWHNKYFMRSAESVLNEIKTRKNEGFKSWVFEDDYFTANKKRVFKICSQLDGQLTWWCQGRAESLDEEMCQELYRAGCRKIILGIESFSQATLDRNNKNTTVVKMIRGIEIAERIGLKTFCLFLVGLPGDTERDINQTIYWLKKVKISQRGFNIAWVLPGTDIYKKAKEYGLNDNVYLEDGAPFYTYEHNMSTLNNWVYQMNNA